MGQYAVEAGRRVLAVAVLIVAAYVLFRVVLGMVMAVAWVIVAILALAAVVWAVRTL